MKTKVSAWKDEDIVDTRKLQIFSLCQVMAAFHYELVEYKGHASRFESKHRSNKGREVISISKAVKLYNGDTAKCVFGRPPSHLTIWSFNDYQVAQAKAARIVKKVKIQHCRATNTLIVQDHRVEFILPSFSKLFLNNKHLG